ncbi:MAG TPA: hypothetical protein VK483_15230 [Chitinophagaceae bacterium]|nr:hypothetical protein [Chitinophagaceae bacterium]
MRKIFLFCMLIPALGISQTKNVISSFRVTPKADKVVEFEKALAAHAQKYHSGDWKWRVFEVQTGPDYGAFHVSEGPASWEAMDSRGDISAEHILDWNKNVMPLTTGAGTSTYSQYNADMSTAQLTDYTDKIVINHIYPKPGMLAAATDITKKLKKVWAANNESVAVYSVIASGEPQIVTVTRLKGGLKELDPTAKKPIAERYNAVYGNGAWDEYLKISNESIDRRWSEILFLRADLSSK